MTRASPARFEQARGIDAHQHGRHDPERRERRVPPADRRLAREDRSEAALAGEVLELRARIGDGDEQLRLFAAFSRSSRCATASRVSTRTSRRRRTASAGDRASPRARGSRGDASCRGRGTGRPRSCAAAPPVRANEPPIRNSTTSSTSSCQRLGEAADAPRALPGRAAARRASRATSPRRCRSTVVASRSQMPSIRRSRFTAHAVTASRLSRTPSSSSANESENFCTPSFSSVSTTSS